MVPNPYIWAILHLYLEPNRIWVQDEIVFGSGTEFHGRPGLTSFRMWDELHIHLGPNRISVWGKTTLGSITKTHEDLEGNRIWN